MFSQSSIQQLLEQTKRLHRTHEEELLWQAKQILQDDLLSEAKVLNNLKYYHRSFEVMNDADCNSNLIFSLEEIKKVAISYRLCFVDSAELKTEVPYEAILKIKDLNTKFAKDLKAFKVLLPAECIKDATAPGSYSLFVKTSTENYFLIHSWGERVSSIRKLRYWHLRSFENLVAAIALFSLCVTLSLPTELITLDHEAQYWSGYRGGVFFHLCFFFSGFTAYFIIAFSISLSSNSWNRK